MRFVMFACGVSAWSGSSASWRPAHRPPRRTFSTSATAAAELDGHESDEPQHERRNERHQRWNERLERLERPTGTTTCDKICAKAASANCSKQSNVRRGLQGAVGADPSGLQVPGGRRECVRSERDVVASAAATASPSSRRAATRRRKSRSVLTSVAPAGGGSSGSSGYQRFERLQRLERRRDAMRQLGDRQRVVQQLSDEQVLRARARRARTNADCRRHHRRASATMNCTDAGVHHDVREREPRRHGARSKRSTAAWQTNCQHPASRWGSALGFAELGMCSLRRDSPSANGA